MARDGRGTMDYTERSRRSTPNEEEEMINSTMDAIMTDMDKNCDGFMDVTEWIRSGSLEQFMELLKRYDTNGMSVKGFNLAVAYRSIFPDFSLIF